MLPLRLPVVLSVFLAAATAQSTIVTLDYGVFTGVNDSSTNIVSFKGIRYANPPVGDNRWRAPVFPPSQVGSVNASSFGAPCISVANGVSEDCLFGNVYTPGNITNQARLPVMVWFHGGGFTSGAGDANPQFLIKSSKSPIIFVAFNYRLGPFGFLGGPQIQRNGSLNAGLQDQRIALRWVKRYISAFGGDPTKVTIFGESAGAGSVMFQLMMSRNDRPPLFRGAIGNSPSRSFLPRFSDDYIQSLFNDFAKHAGCDTAPDALSCLRALNTSQLVSAGGKTTASRPATIYAFAPLNDGEFVAEGLDDAFPNGRIARVPLMFGSNTNEGAGWSTGVSDPAANTNTPGSTTDTVYNFFKGQFASYTKESFNEALPLYANYTTTMNLLAQQMYGEARYICPSSVITGGGKKVGLKTYQYRYDNPQLGSNHGQDLTGLYSSGSGQNTENQKLFEAMRQYWTSFVIDRAPSATDSAAWTAVGSENGNPRLLLNPLPGPRMESLDEGLLTRCAYWHRTVY